MNQKVVVALGQKKKKKKQIIIEKSRVFAIELFRCLNQLPDFSCYLP